MARVKLCMHLLFQLFASSQFLKINSLILTMLVVSSFISSHVSSDSHCFLFISSSIKRLAILSSSQCQAMCLYSLHSVSLLSWHQSVYSSSRFLQLSPFSAQRCLGSFLFKAHARTVHPNNGQVGVTTRHKFFL